jgi:hypothetical protein
MLKFWLLLEFLRTAQNKQSLQSGHPGPGGFEPTILVLKADAVTTLPRHPAVFLLMLPLHTRAKTTSIQQHLATRPMLFYSYGMKVHMYVLK